MNGSSTTASGQLPAPSPSFLSFFFLPISSLFSLPCFRFVHGAMELAGRQGLPSPWSAAAACPYLASIPGPHPRRSRPTAYEAGLPLAKPPPELLPSGSAPGRSPKSIPGPPRPFPARLPSWRSRARGRAPPIILPIPFLFCAHTHAHSALAHHHAHAVVLAKPRPWSRPALFCFLFVQISSSVSFMYHNTHILSQVPL